MIIIYYFWFFGLINNKHKDNGICMSLWVPRTIITILLPPFGVYMARGINGFKYVMICSLLTCVFYFPGLIYAFIVMGNSKTAEENYKDFIQIYNNSARQDKSMYHELAHGIGHKIEEPSLVTKTPDAVIDGKTYSSQK